MKSKRIVLSKEAFCEGKAQSGTAVATRALILCDVEHKEHDQGVACLMYIWKKLGYLPSWGAPQDDEEAKTDTLRVSKAQAKLKQNK